VEDESSFSSEYSIRDGRVLLFGSHQFFRGVIFR